MEILLEAGLVTGGCMKNVGNGTAYSKALYNLKASCEGLERMMIDQFVKEEDVMISPRALLDLVTEVSRENLDKALSDESTRAVFDKYIDYQENKVKKGHLGVTTAHWLSFIEKCRELFMLLYSIKKNHVPLYHYLMGAMDLLFFQTDGQNYARYNYMKPVPVVTYCISWFNIYLSFHRYLAWFEAFLTNLELTHSGGTALL